MRRKNNKLQKLNKGAPSGLVISLLVHAAVFLLAGALVVFNAVKKEEKKFVPPPPAERPKMKLKKPKPRVEKASKPKQTTRIVTKVQKAIMPDIHLPELSGMGDGLAGGLGDGFDLMPDLNEISIFGSSQSIGNDLEGTFYDFKRDRSGRPIPYSRSMYWDIIRKFVNDSWNTSRLERYYKSPRKLYATAIVVPPVLSEIAPAAFGEDDVEGNFWMVHYKGQLVNQRDITFRFVASGDEIILIRVDREIVMGVAWWYDEPDIIGDIWSSSSADTDKYWLGNQTATMGDWISLKAGEPLDMEIIVADNGGQACLMIGIEEKGVEYERRTVGGPTFPVFKTAHLSMDQLDVIYQNMVAEELCLTNGPVFCDYGTEHIAQPLVKAPEPKPDNTPEEKISTNRLRSWTLTDGTVIEAEYLSQVGNTVTLRDAGRKQKKIPLVRFSDPDRTYLELADPPRLKLSVSSSDSPKFSIKDGSSSGIAVAYTYMYTAKVKQTDAAPYNHELHVEFFAIGAEIHGDNYVLLDRQESRFTPSVDNQYSHRFSGNTVELPDFVLEEIRRGIKDFGYLITVTDERGELIAYKTTAKWLYENLDALKKLPVGRFMDQTCTRVFPTGPKRTRY